MRVGLDPGLCYLFIEKNNTNSEDKKLLAKISSKEYNYELSVIGMSVGRRSVMQDVHGGKK
jgi:hypothetical protein